MDPSPSATKRSASGYSSDENDEDKNPSFEVLVKDSYIKQHYMHIPKHFYDHIPESHSIAVLRYDGEPWFMEINMGKRRGSKTDEFESLCEETQAGTTLNMVEELVEEQRLEESLNPLFLERSNTEEVLGHCLSEAKKDEISYLMAMLEKAEEQKRAVTSLLEALKKERHDSTDNEDRTRSLL